MIFSVSDKYKYDIVFTFILLGLVSFLNYFFIPKFGIAGAALSTGIAYVSYNTGRLLFIWKTYKLHPFQVNQFKIIGLFSILCFLFEIKNWQFEMIIEVLLNSLIFCLLFITPIYIFNWEPELKSYWLKGKKFILSKR